MKPKQDTKAPLPNKKKVDCPLCLFSSGIVANGKGSKCSLCGGSGKVTASTEKSFNKKYDLKN